MKKLFVTFQLMLAVVVVPMLALSQPNGLEPFEREPAVYHHISPAADLINCDDILCFTDDIRFPAPNTYVDQALQQLGCSYTMYYRDLPGFINALNSQSWDIVIFNRITTFGVTPRTALTSHVLNGGSLIYNDWTVYEDPAHPLYTTLGFSYISYYNAAIPVYAWETSHPAFNIPNVVNKLLSPVDYYNVDGQYVATLPGFQKLAGFTTPGPDPNQEAIILGNNDKTVFFSFTPSYFQGDYNGNGKLDMVELYENMIKGLCEGFAPPAVPVSNWALFIGISLILVFAVVRFRKMV